MTDDFLPLQLPPLQPPLPMSPIKRRDFLKRSMAAGAASLAPVALGAATPRQVFKGSRLHIATFRFDVTPPKGHSLCGGWIKPVVDYDDPLEAIGYVLLGAGQPVVFCVVDWAGILNDAGARGVALRPSAQHSLGLFRCGAPVGETRRSAAFV